MILYPRPVESARPPTATARTRTRTAMCGAGRGSALVGSTRTTCSSGARKPASCADEQNAFFFVKYTIHDNFRALRDLENSGLTLTSSTPPQHIILPALL